MMAVINAQSGAVVERHRLNADGIPGKMGLTLSSPVIVNGRLFVGSETGGVRCFAGSQISAAAPEAGPQKLSQAHE
jgi:hypothetical protein